MVGGGFAEPELEEDLADVGLDGALAEEQALADALVGVAFGHEGEYLAFARGELLKGPGVAARDQPGDDGGIDDALALGYAPQRVGEHGDVGDAVLEQV